MEQPELLGSTFSCDCGREHTVPTEQLCYQSDAISELVAYTQTFDKSSCYLLVADTRTFEAAGQNVADALIAAGALVKIIIVPDHNGESPITDNKTKNYLLGNAPESDILIAIGSGVINDLTKWIAHLRQKPYIVVPTAASMNGYASANVSATVDGLKILFQAEACKAVFAVPEIIEKAPFELTASGLGDVIAKTVSSADWRLNQFLFNEYYCQFSVDLLKDLEPIYLNNPQKIKNLDHQAIQALFKALFYSSVAMTITNTSSPASGGEHLISHTLDMTADRDGVTHDYHGRQVGVSTVLMSALYEKVLSIQTPEFKPLPSNINTSFWGSLSGVIEGEYKKKLPKSKLVIEKLSEPTSWNKLRTTLKKNMVSPKILKNCLKEGGAAYRFSEILSGGASLSRKRFYDTVLNANRMRERFTILDLAFMVGVLPDQLNGIIDQWVK